jgi:hypothetical protein
MLLPILLAGLGSLICQPVHAQTVPHVPSVRFEWIDPQDKFAGVENGKPDIEKAVTRQISRNSKKIHTGPGAAAGTSCPHAVAEWLIRIEVEQRVLTFREKPETWWRVNLDVCVGDGDKSRLITRDDNRILYDFDDFPPFEDTSNLLSDLTTRVGRQLMQFGQAVQEASSTESGSDFKEVVHQVRTAIEADDLPAVEAILEQHEWKFDAVKLNSLGDSQLVGFLEYHKMLGGLNTRLGEWGGVSEASDAVEYLERAQQASYLLEDRLGGSNRGLEIPDLYRLNREISTMLDLARALGDISDLPGSSHPLIPESVDYIGDDVRIAIGYDSETDLTGDFFWNVFENADSAVSFEGWKGNESSGGLKLNYHWLGGERKSGKDIYGETIYLDGRVRKLFLATDWNVYGDGKLTLGGGGERQDRFWSAYASKSITGERLLYSDSSSIGNETSGITIDLHPWRQTDTLTTTTEHLAHPYDWGVGFRFGQFVNSSLLRLRGGLDYEFGETWRNVSLAEITACRCGSRPCASGGILKPTGAMCGSACSGVGTLARFSDTSARRRKIAPLSWTPGSKRPGSVAPCAIRWGTSVPSITTVMTGSVSSLIRLTSCLMKDRLRWMTATRKMKPIPSSGIPPPTSCRC